MLKRAFIIHIYTGGRFLGEFHSVCKTEGERDSYRGGKLGALSEDPFSHLYPYHVPRTETRNKKPSPKLKDISYQWADTWSTKW